MDFNIRCANLHSRRSWNKPGSQIYGRKTQHKPIPTEAPWSLGHNERSHRYIHSAIDKIMAANPTTEIENLLSEVEMAWNFSQHADCEIPHFNRFGTNP